MVLMDRAVELARGSRPHPNPRVGAVIVGRDGAIVGEGGHEGPGTSHAEIVALSEAGAASQGATLYVTLEPCNHQGRTGPCVSAIVEAGIREVVIGARDPNPGVAGGGVEALEEAGITVHLLDPSDESSDPGYFHYHRTGRPLVTLKAALTLDGATAALDGTSQWITNAASRADAHRLRARSDAIVVGAATVRSDDPRLTVRLPDFTGTQPVPVILRGRGDIPSDRQILTRDPIVAEPGPDGRVELHRLLHELAAQGHLDVLIEGGPTTARAFWEAGLVDRGVFYFGGKVAGGAGRPVLEGPFGTLEQAQSVTIVAVDQLDGDVRLEFDVHGNR